MGSGLSDEEFRQVPSGGFGERVVKFDYQFPEATMLGTPSLAEGIADADQDYVHFEEAWSAESDEAFSDVLRGIDRSLAACAEHGRHIDEGLKSLLKRG